MKNQPEKSNCCGAPVKVVGDETMHWECTKCERACDIQPEKTVEEHLRFLFMTAYNVGFNHGVETGNTDEKWKADFEIKLFMDFIKKLKKEKSFIETEGSTNTAYKHYSGYIDGWNSFISYIITGLK